MAPRRIAVVTGTRAEYGLLSPLLRVLSHDPAVDLQLLVTGMHLSSEFGLTYRAIEEDGFTIDARIEMLLSSDTPVGTSTSLAVGIMGLASALERLRPDILVVLGDRFEVLAAAQAAMMARIPIAHIHGGELTEGAVDEAIRHAVTKMAHLHFTAAAPYRERVIQLGEQPAAVYMTGALGLDRIAQTPPVERQVLESELEFPLGPGPLLVCTYHPETLSDVPPADAVAALFTALDRWPDARVIITKANADPGGRSINRTIDALAAERADRIKAFVSLGDRRYLSLMRLASAVVGNSSSGIIEAPFVKTPSVNIGDRQAGRLRAPSVIDCGPTSDGIAAAIGQALSPDMAAIASAGRTPYGDGAASQRIASTLRSVSLDGILIKRFHDQPPRGS